jgi:histidine triad (HIT) family protein
MSYTYDPENIFAKILRGEIPNATIFEDEFALAFKDIEPMAPVHVLVIPKGAYVNMDHFTNEASDAEVLGFNRAIGKTIALLGVAPRGDEAGYRVIANTGRDGRQDVPHLHMHILGGRSLGRMIQKAD